MSLVVLSEAPAPDQATSRNVQELAHQTEAARLLGCRIIPLPTDFSVCQTAANALAAPLRPTSRALADWRLVEVHANRSTSG